MSYLLGLVVSSLRDTVVALVPIVALLVGMQWLVLRRPLPQLRRTLLGLVFVVAGMSLFLAGLEETLFPLGRLMAGQLTDPGFIGEGATAARWQDYLWVYAFGAAIGFATTVAEPALIAVALKAHQVSADTINAWGLRVAVALGVAVGIALGTFRIVTGTPLPAYIIAGYVIVLLQASRAPRAIVALAFDTGGVTTSTVTVPLVAALGLGLASTIPGRSPLVDGFGLIAFASLFPMMTVMGYAQLARWRAERHQTREV
ncbi:MAG: DUF1538 domain-containing protein [Nocardioidaceae bacterium]|nr:DUF1538 domain-containing protein [Nocardioidaceae bacterium]